MQGCQRKTSGISGILGGLQVICQCFKQKKWWKSPPKNNTGASPVFQPWRCGGSPTSWNNEYGYIVCLPIECEIHFPTHPCITNLKYSDFWSLRIEECLCHHSFNFFFMCPCKIITVNSSSSKCAQERNPMPSGRASKGHLCQLECAKLKAAVTWSIRCLHGPTWPGPPRCHGPGWNALCNYVAILYQLLSAAILLIKGSGLCDSGIQ